MVVVVNMVLAVALIAAAPGAVPKFQLRVAYICAAANGALVIVGCLRLVWRGLLHIPVGEGNDPGTVCFPFRFFPEQPLGFQPEGEGNQVKYVLACEEQVIGETCQREQIVGEERGEVVNLNTNQYQIQKRQKPGLNRYNEKYKELTVGAHSGEHQNEA